MTAAQYRTTDRYLAAFLCFKGAVLEDWQRLGPKKVEFCFTAGPRLHELLRLYWSGHLLPLIPSQLFKVHHRLKCLAIERR